MCDTKLNRNAALFSEISINVDVSSSRASSMKCCKRVAIDSSFLKPNVGLVSTLLIQLNVPRQLTVTEMAK